METTSESDNPIGILSNKVDENTVNQFTTYHRANLL